MERMNYTYKKIWLVNFPVMTSILTEQLINITDAVFLGISGRWNSGHLLWLQYGIWLFICWVSASVWDCSP